MSDDFISISGNKPVFTNSSAADKYVAFVDLLGFGSRIESDFSKAVALYQQLLDLAGPIRNMRKDARIKVMSDAFVITADMLSSVVAVVQALQFQTLFFDCLTRGGISFGKHIEADEHGNAFVVSQPLVEAVRLEKSVIFPCVKVSENLPIPDDWWRTDIPPIQRGLLFFEGITVVNPFNIMWGRSARQRVVQMPRDNPYHNQKYDWFLRLFDAVISEQPLIPERHL